MLYSVGILIVSDRAASGQREDLCLPVFEALLAGTAFVIRETIITSDTPQKIKKALENMISEELNLILTSGGTGCGPRDNTPDVTKTLLDKPTPGLDEAIRHFSKQKSRYAIYSRAVSGVAGKSFLVNLPGSPHAVKEILDFLLPTIEHPLKLIANRVTDCISEIQNDD